MNDAIYYERSYLLTKKISYSTTILINFVCAFLIILKRFALVPYSNLSFFLVKIMPFFTIRANFKVASDKYSEELNELKKHNKEKSGQLDHYCRELKETISKTGKNHKLEIKACNIVC